VVILFFTGTVIGLFIQSLWAIFITSQQATDGES
jgi:RsiW-degrading membrane proteinase PrsW (M82 family)